MNDQQSDVVSHKIDVPEYEACTVGELVEADFAHVADIITHDVTGIMGLTFSLERPLAALGSPPPTALQKILLLKPENRRVKALRILRALHRDENSQLFAIDSSNDEVQGLVVLALHEGATHLSAWIHKDHRNQHLGEEAIKVVLARHLRKESQVVIHTTVEKKSVGSLLLQKKLAFTGPERDLNSYSLTNKHRPVWKTEESEIS